MAINPALQQTPPRDDMPPSPLPYHRLAQRHTGTARWWRPLAVLGTAAGLYAAGLLVAFVVSLILVLTAPGPWGPSAELMDPTNPMDLLLLLGFIALGLPAVVLGSRWGGGMRGAIHSVTGRVRWRLLLRAAVVVVPLYALVYTLTFVLAPPEDLAAPALDGRTVLVVVIILLLVPLQCAAEEYAFRALPQQLLGTWLRSPLWGILLPVPLFMIGHGANNLILFLLAPFSPGSLQQGAVPPATLLLSLPLTLLVTAALTVWVSRRSGLRWFQPVRSVPQHAGPPRAAPLNAGFPVP